MYPPKKSWLLPIVVLALAAGPAFGAIPASQVPAAPDPPAVTFPTPDGTVSQATDAITFAAHEGSIVWLTIASSPLTIDEQFGRAPSGNPELVNKVANVFGGGAGATKVPLSTVTRTLPPGRYWFNIVWTYDKSYDVCFVVNAQTGGCLDGTPTGPWRVQALRLSTPQSFVIAAPPLAPVALVPPPSTNPRVGATRSRHPVNPSACRKIKAALPRNASLIRRAQKSIKSAASAKVKRVARGRVLRLKATRAVLLSKRNRACRLV